MTHVVLRFLASLGERLPFLLGEPRDYSRPERGGPAKDAAAIGSDMARVGLDLRRVVDLELTRHER